MNLFVIGNGFDLAHGLETRYEHFRGYLEEEDWEFLSSLEEMYGFRVGDFIEHIGEDNWKQNVKEYLWQDFESNLSEIDETIIYEAEDMDLGVECEFGVIDTWDEHWKNQYRFIGKLNEYVMSWVKNVDIHSNIRASVIDTINNDKFITFNYTLLLEEIYNIDKTDILHIHGSIDEEDYSPVIGHGDKEKIDEMFEIAREAFEKNNERRSSIYKAIAKYCRDTLKNVSNFLNENRNFFKSLNEVNEIHIIGHSLGDVDIPYFREIKRNVNENIIWNVYYYSDNDMLTYRDKIISIGIIEENIRMIHSSIFFN